MVMGHDDESLQAGDSVDAHEVALDKAPSRCGKVVFGAGMVRWQLWVVQCSHGEDNEEQRELLQVHPLRQRLVRVSVHLVEDGLDALPRSNVVTIVSLHPQSGSWFEDSLPCVVLVVAIKQIRRNLRGGKVALQRVHCRRRTPAREWEQPTPVIDPCRGRLLR